MNISLHLNESTDQYRLHDNGRHLIVNLSRGEFELIQSLIEAHPGGYRLRALSKRLGRRPDGLKQAIFRLRRKANDKGFILRDREDGYTINPLED